MGGGIEEVRWGRVGVHKKVSPIPQIGRCLKPAYRRQAAGNVHLPVGFSNRNLRERLAPLLGIDPARISPGMMTYDLRRLRLHGVIERISRTHRYRLTTDGLRVALFFSRAYGRLLRPALSAVTTHPAPSPRRDPAANALAQLADSFDHVMDLCGFQVA